jgi:hypothetical protein
LIFNGVYTRKIIDMPTAANIVLADAAGTPVNHTFVPNGKDATETYWYIDRSQANSIGYWRISAQLVEPPVAKQGDSSKERTYRVKIGLHEPVLETLSNSTVSGITPAPTVAYIPRVFTEYVVSERSSLLERQHLRKMNALLQAHAQMVDLVENFSRITG